ncbi:hypothetical protein JCM10207_003348 [Rhodosporidiobolus poonsookiae]
MAIKKRTSATQGSWTPSPSPSPSPPTSPINLDISDEHRFQLLEDLAPAGVRPSDLGTSTGVRGGKGKQPMVVVSPEELDEMVRRQKEGGAAGNGVLPGEEDEEQEEEEPALWEDIANAVLWTMPFAFLFCGMDYAVHAQFGQRLVPSEEAYRILNVLPALFLLNLIALLSPTRRILPPMLLQPLLLALSIYSGLALIHTTTTAGYLRVMARAPVLGALWCWTVVQMDLVFAVLGLVGVAVGVTVRGEMEAVNFGGDGAAQKPLPTSSLNVRGPSFGVVDTILGQIRRVYGCHHSVRDGAVSGGTIPGRQAGSVPGQAKLVFLGRIGEWQGRIRTLLESRWYNWTPQQQWAAVVILHDALSRAQRGDPPDDLPPLAHFQGIDFLRGPTSRPVSTAPQPIMQQQPQWVAAQPQPPQLYPSTPYSPDPHPAPVPDYAQASYYTPGLPPSSSDQPVYPTTPAPRPQSSIQSRSSRHTRPPPSSHGRARRTSRPTPSQRRSRSPTPETSRTGSVRQREQDTRAPSPPIEPPAFYPPHAEHDDELARYFDPTHASNDALTQELMGQWSLPHNGSSHAASVTHTSSPSHQSGANSPGRYYSAYADSDFLSHEYDPEDVLRSLGVLSHRQAKVYGMRQARAF